MFYAFSAILLLAFYFSVTLLKNPQFILNDLQEKYARVAGSATMNISLRVVGPPGKPNVVLNSGCTQNTSYVEISWNATNDTSDYDVYRDGALLTTGLVGTSYTDATVANLTAYTYQVIANGPLGNTASDDENITTQDCQIVIIPSCTIQTFQNKLISEYSGTPKTKVRNPIFTGITNIPNADISILILGKTNLFSNLSANINGYWSWTSPVNLNYGIHRIWVTAVDPLDPTRHATDTILFEISKKDKDEDKDDDDTKKEEPPVTPVIPPKTTETIIPPEEIEKIQIPLNISLDVLNPNDIVFSDEKLETATDINHRTFGPKNLNLIYEIFDPGGKKIIHSSQDLLSTHSETFKKNFSLPKLSPSGKYKITVKTSYGGFDFSSEEFFQFRESPLIDFGGGLTVTTSDLLKKISWIILFLILLILLFIILLLIERQLSKHALYQITEDFLGKKGFFGKRKGVSK